MINVSPFLFLSYKTTSLEANNENMLAFKVMDGFAVIIFVLITFNCHTNLLSYQCISLKLLYSEGKISC